MTVTTTTYLRWKETYIKHVYIYIYICIYVGGREREAEFVYLASYVDRKHDERVQSWIRGSCVSVAVAIRVSRPIDRPWNALTTLFVWSLLLFAPPLPLPLPLPDWLRVDFRLYRDERASLRKFPTITISDVHMSLSLWFGPSKKRAINWSAVWDRGPHWRFSSPHNDLLSCGCSLCDSSVFSWLYSSERLPK
jgi:hypothetical protein